MGLQLHVPRHIKNDSSPAIREMWGFSGVGGNGRMLLCIGDGSLGTRPRLRLPSSRGLQPFPLLLFHGDGIVPARLYVFSRFNFDCGPVIRKGCRQTTGRELAEV